MIGLAALLFAWIEIPEEARVVNNGPNCMWACLATLANMHDIEAHKDLLNRRIRYQAKNGFKGATDGEIKEWLDKQGLMYLQTKWDSTDKNKDYALLERYGYSYGVAVAFKAGFRPRWMCHAVVVVEFTDKFVMYWDPNFPKYRFTVTRQWFDYWWNGMSVVVIRNPLQE